MNIRTRIMGRVAVAAIGILWLANVIAGEKACEEIELVRPADRSTVELLRPLQKAWMKMPRAERVEKIADTEGFRKEMVAEGTHPRPVVLEWRCNHGADGKCRGTYAIEVTKRRDGKLHYSAENLKTNCVELWNLEVGEEYTWCVWCGKKANGWMFKTEDIAPRWLKWKGVHNVRDHGGWKTKDGFRVKQGLAYRSAGLNDNALTCLTVEETMALHQAGQLEALFGAKGREIAELIDAGKMEPNDGRLRKTFKRDKFEKGKLRGTPESREYVRTFFGIRTDLDLRTEEPECWGMTESPLGNEVAWLNYSGLAYSGMVLPKGKEQFHKALEVFLDPQRYGIVYHCIGGADRTGAVAFIINALLGVDEEDLWRDWEITCFGGQRRRFTHEFCFKHLVKAFDIYPGATINERVVNYVKDIGFTDADIARLRDMLLDRGGHPQDLRGLPIWYDPSGIKNMRDLGGWTGHGGRKVKTGRIFRSASFEKVKPEGRDYVVNKLGVKTDLDLRTPEQVKKEIDDKSPLGVKLVNRSSTAYGGFDTESGRKYFAETFRWFLNEAEYPVAMHCAKGADRTGSWAFLLNGLLGVAESDLRYDWELTHGYNPNPLFKHRTRYNKLVEMIEKREGATFADKMVAYAKDCGITDEEIAKWRSMMLEAALPFEMPEVKAPVFPSRDFVITEYGAKAGEKCTAAFAKAMEACAKAGGGRIVVPKGVWFTGPIHLKSNCNLFLSDGATVEFSDDPKDYLPAVPVSWEGLECVNYSPLVYAYGCKNVAITGRGELKPRMERWRELFKESKTGIQQARGILYKWGAEDYPVEKRVMPEASAAIMRPHLIHLNRCSGILIDGVKIRDSPFWTMHLFMSENAIVRNVDSSARGFNNDGVDIEMTRNVVVENCVFDQGDDGIVLKSGRNRDAWRVNRPTENVVVTNCEFKSADSLVGVGSELSGGIRNFYMADCKIEKAYRMIYFKTNRRRGGVVENIYVQDVEAGEVTHGVVELKTDILYQWAEFPDYELRTTVFRDIDIRNVKAKSAGWLVDVIGDPKEPVRRMKLENLTVEKVSKGQRRIENVVD